MLDFYARVVSYVQLTLLRVPCADFYKAYWISGPLDMVNDLRKKLVEGEIWAAIVVVRLANKFICLFFWIWNAVL